MSAILDTLRHIFKGANPDASDEEINTQLNSYSQDPALAEALKGLVPSPDAQTEDTSTPPKTDTSDNLSIDPSFMESLNQSSVNSTPSSFDVHESTSPVAMRGAMPVAPEGNIPQPASLPTAPTNEPSMPAMEIPQPKKLIVKQPASVEEQPQMPAEAPLAENLSDNDKRLRMQAEADKQKLRGILPILVGGAGDAISTAGTAFGAQAGTPVLDKIVDMESKDIKENKAQFEENLKNDPGSDVSKSYQKVLGMMMGKPATDPDIMKMSAATIAAQLPEVEKFMAKQLGMEQIKATKELSRAQQQGNERDRLWQQAVQSLSSVRGDTSVKRVEEQRDAAITAYNTIDNIKKEGRKPSQVEYYDLLGQMWKARTGAAPTEQAIRDLDAKTFKGDIGRAATYFTGQPAAATTQGVLDNLQSFIKQTGLQADKLHEGYMQAHGANVMASRMKELYPEDAARLQQMSRGTSFADATGATNAPTTNKILTATNKTTGKRIKSIDGGQTWQPM